MCNRQRKDDVQVIGLWLPNGLDTGPQAGRRATPFRGIDGPRQDRLSRPGVRGPDRWDRLLSSHARPGRVAWPARLGGGAYATVGRRDDRRGVDDAACRIAVRQPRAACRSVAPDAASASRSSRQPAAEKRSVVTARRKTGARAGSDVRRQAWEWATA